MAALEEREKEEEKEEVWLIHSSSAVCRCWCRRSDCDAELMKSEASHHAVWLSGRRFDPIIVSSSVGSAAGGEGGAALCVMLTDSKQPSEAPSWLVSAEVTKGNQLPDCFFFCSSCCLSNQLMASHISYCTCNNFSALKKAVVFFLHKFAQLRKRRHMFYELSQEG